MDCDRLSLSFLLLFFFFSSLLLGDVDNPKGLLAVGFDCRGRPSESKGRVVKFGLDYFDLVRVAMWNYFRRNKRLGLDLSSGVYVELPSHQKLPERSPGGDTQVTRR